MYETETRKAVQKSPQKSLEPSRITFLCVRKLQQSRISFTVSVGNNVTRARMHAGVDNFDRFLTCGRQRAGIMRVAGVPLGGGKVDQMAPQADVLI